jgi:hypothetical protein
MGTVVRLYLGWRLIRLIRPLLAAALVATALLAVRAGHVPARHSAGGALQGGAAAIGHGLPRAFEHAFQSSSR